MIVKFKYVDIPIPIIDMSEGTKGRFTVDIPQQDVMEYNRALYTVRRVSRIIDNAEWIYPDKR